MLTLSSASRDVFMRPRDAGVPGSRRHSRLFARLLLERLQREDPVAAGPCHNESVARRCPKLLNEPHSRSPTHSFIYNFKKRCVIHRPSVARPSRRSPATSATKPNPAKCIRRRELLQIRGPADANQRQRKKKKIRLAHGGGEGCEIHRKQENELETR